MIIDFEVTNSRLAFGSKTDNGQPRTQLRFTFDDSWTGFMKTAVFIPTAQAAPLSICLDSENSCFAAAEAAGEYEMYIVGSDSTKKSAVTTNSVNVTLAEGSVIVLPPSTTAALIDELNEDTEAIKKQLTAAAEAAETLTKAAEDYEKYKTDVDTALAGKAEQSDVDVINAVLSGAIKNKGDVKSLSLTLPVTDSTMLNCAYNVISGFIPGVDSTIYAWAAFQYKITLNHVKVYVDTATNKYYLEVSTDTDIPSQLYYINWGEKIFYNEPQTIAIAMNGTVQRFKYIGYSTTQTLYEKILRFEWITTPGGTDISSFRDASEWVYTADNVAAAWSVSMSIDDNFVITEHGFDIQSYKITDYVTQNKLTSALNGKVDKVTGKGLSTYDFTAALRSKLNNDYTKAQIDTKVNALQSGIDEKANAADVYTKTETDTALALKANAADVYTKTEIDSAGYVKDTDYADWNKGGVVKIGNGVAINSSGGIYVNKSETAEIAARTNQYKPIVPANLNTAVKAALTDDKRISDMTDAEKANARDVIGANGKYDTIIDYTYTGEEALTELNILLTQEQLQKIKKYEKFFSFVTYTVPATTGNTSFWGSATLCICEKGKTIPRAYAGFFARAACTVQKVASDNTPITWVASTEKVVLPDNKTAMFTVLDYGATQYDLFNASATYGHTRVKNVNLYTYGDSTYYDKIIQIKAPVAMPIVQNARFVLWGK